MTREQQHSLDRHLRSSRMGLLAYVRSKMPYPEAEDLLQDVYVQALRSLNILDEVDNLAGWLFTIARNKVIDWYRLKKIPTVSLDEKDEDGTSLQEVFTSEIPVDWDDETRELVLEAILESVDELPEKQRYVFLENAVEGRTFRELAEETGESINTLLARKRYAVQFLRKRLHHLKQLINQ